MNSFKIAFMNFKHNIKTYSMYLFAMIFSVATYYNFLSMRYNPQFLETENMSKYVESTSVSVSLIMIIFLIFFITYSSNFFLSQRKREIGVYAFMGIDNQKIGFIFALEGLILGILSLVSGIVIGVLFSKLFLMMLAKVALLDMTIKFFISKKAITGTIIVYSIILFITFLKGYLDIVRTNLIDLLNSLKKEEEVPKVNYLKGIFSIIIIGIAYFIALSYKTIGFDSALLITIFLLIWGTYWLFGSFLSMIIRHYTNKKSFLYKGVNIISISNIAFRIKNNYRTLAVVTILITTTVTCFGTVGSLRYFVDKNYNIEVPYTVSYISDDKNVTQKVNNVIEKQNRKVQLREKVNFLSADSVVILKTSDFKRILSDLKVENAKDIVSKFNFSKDEVGYIERPGVVISLLKHDDIMLNNIKFNIKVNTKVPFLGNGVPYPCIIVNDENYFKLKDSFKEKQFNGIILDYQKDNKALTMNLAEELSSQEVNLYTSFLADASFYDFIGILYFIGAFLSLVFMFATGSIIYFKILSESFRDKSKYKILKKIGTTDIEISKSVSKQVGMFFILPLIVGSIHSIIAIMVLGDIMKSSLVVPTIISIGIISLMYGIFYIFTKNRFMKIIRD